MRRRIAIIGSGPTGIYTARYLLDSGEPLHIVLFEAQSEAGKGTPYHQNWNDREMLSNIASLEIPPVTETLVEWLESQSERRLLQLGIVREDIDERSFFPRVVLGEYFQAQLMKLLARSKDSAVDFHLRPNTRVLDIIVCDHGIDLSIRQAEGTVQQEEFDEVIMATGHVWPKETEVRPGYFLSPWPATALSSIPHCHVGVRGTSLSGIDAVVALAVARGTFLRDNNGRLQYLAEPGTEAFHVTMMSRKGLLPEADFYYPLPYQPLDIFTTPAIEHLVACCPRAKLLDEVYELFKAQLASADPAYAQSIHLETLNLEQFAGAYFAEREAHDPFVWAEHNLAEAQANRLREFTVPWRYAILRMHEIIKDVVRHLNADDHRRFNAHLKHIFVDDYATVPHESIERLLALHRVGKLEILRLGNDYRIDTEASAGGAVCEGKGQRLHFAAFIEAMGQRILSAHEFPFPSLWRQGIVQDATAQKVTYNHLGQRIREAVPIGGVALDPSFRPVSDSPVAAHLYCLSLPFLLGQFPFAQGITSSHEMGKAVVEHLLKSSGINNAMPMLPPAVMGGLELGAA